MTSAYDAISVPSMNFDDFKNLQPLGKLDFILEVLNHDRNLQMIYQIEKAIGWETNKIEIDKELNLIIDKLLKDGYILEKHVDEKTVPPWITYEPGGQAYYISFEGKVLLDMGGYTKQRKNRDAENTRLDKLASYQTKLSEQLSVATWALAIGTFLLVAIEILKWWYE